MKSLGRGRGIRKTKRQRQVEEETDKWALMGHAVMGLTGHWHTPFQAGAWMKLTMMKDTARIKQIDKLLPFTSDHSIFVPLSPLFSPNLMQVPSL